MRVLFGAVAAVLSLASGALVSLYIVGVARRVRAENRSWTDYPALFVEHWEETAISFCVLLLGFVLLVASVNLLGRRDLDA